MTQCVFDGAAKPRPRPGLYTSTNQSFLSRVLECIHSYRLQVYQFHKWYRPSESLLSLKNFTLTKCLF